jgi:hypothetical protein
VVKTTVATLITALGLARAGTFPAPAQGPNAERPCSPLGDASKPLSQKLDQGSGVLCPPDVDPGMKAPTPETGKTPVIPPPGSPGGDPKVPPK